MVCSHKATFAALFFFAGIAALTNSPQVRAQTAADYTLVEASTSPTGQVVSDPEAYGGSYVQQTSAWQPMIVSPVPASGDSWVIWARIKDVNVQLKAVAADGTQNALNWEWAQPDDWTWVSLGRHTRAELGPKILLMRGPNAGQSPGLDAVLFANDDSFDPNVSVPQPNFNYPPVTVTIDWRKQIATATQLSYGLYAFGGVNHAFTHVSAYEANMEKMDAGLLRLHNWGMMNDSATDPTGWIDLKNKCWDADKIKKDLSGAYGYGPNLLINIPAWPSWMDKNGMLDPTQEDAFAGFCADLVRIVNVDLKLHVKYWEVTNERDGPYYGNFHNSDGTLKNPSIPDHVDDLATIYNKCAVAMKAVEPAIKVGGPAVARPDWSDFIARFTQQTAGNLDFFSFHAYGSGSKDDSDKFIFNRAAGFGDDVTQIKGILTKVSPDRPIPVFLDEYNISWSWDVRDPRMTNLKGMIFDAIAITGAVENGAAATTAWNEKDGVYGKMDDSYNLRPGASLFELLNKHMIGTVVSAVSSEPNSIAAYAVRRPNGDRALLLINRTKHDRTVDQTSSGAPLPVLSEFSDTSGMPEKGPSAGVTVPAESIVFLGR